MPRGEARVISVLLLAALGLALASVALGPGFHPPGHYDGDEDDVGLVWRTLSQWADVPATGSELRSVAAAPAERLVPDGIAGPRSVTRDPLGSRAPPA